MTAVCSLKSAAASVRASARNAANAASAPKGHVADAAAVVFVTDAARLRSRVAAYDECAARSPHDEDSLSLSLNESRNPLARVASRAPVPRTASSADCC